MRTIELKTLRLDCGGCPTAYSGETVQGDQFSCRLRHGYMRINLNSAVIADGSPINGADGVCSFEDFKKLARRKGIIIDESEAIHSSYIDDMEELVRKLQGKGV